MKYRFALYATVCMTLVNLPVLQAEQRQLEMMGTGTVTNDNETIDAEFELWANGGKVSLIKILTGHESAQITMTSYSADGLNASGNITCDSGICPCQLQTNSANTALWGVCTDPNYGQLHINISYISKQ